MITKMNLLLKKMKLSVKRNGTTLPLVKDKEVVVEIANENISGALLRDKEKHNRYLEATAKEYDKIENICFNLKQMEKFYDITPMRELKKKVSQNNCSSYEKHEYEKLLKTFCIIGYKKLENAKESDKAVKVLGVAIMTPEIAEISWEYEEIFLIGSSIVNNMFQVESTDFFDQGLPPDELLRNLLNYAEARNVSDLHLKPYDDYSYELTGRINQKLFKLREKKITYSEAQSLIVAMKNNSNRSHSTREKEVRSLIKMQLNNGKVRNFRYHEIESNTGNNGAASISIRRLASREELMSMSALGFSDNALSVIRAVCNQNTNGGLVVLSGETNSGKTTSLYSMLLDMYEYNGDMKRINSIESPIEIVVPELDQVDILEKKSAHENIRVSMDEAIGHQLSHDPDVVLISEVRFKDEIANTVELARNGHFAFTTIHANDNKASLQKMMDFGNIRAEDLNDKIRMLMNLKLVPRICNMCNNTGILDNKKSCPKCKGMGADGVALVYDIIAFHNLDKNDDITDFKKLEEDGKAIWIKKETVIRGLVKKGMIDKAKFENIGAENIYDFYSLEKAASL